MSVKAALLNPTSLTIGGGVAAAVGGVVVPAAIVASMDSADADDAPAPLVMPEAPEDRTVFLGLRELVLGAGLVLSVHEGGAGQPAWAAFWTEDAYEPGVVNESEILVLAHNPLLQTVSVFSAPDRTTENNAPIPFSFAAGDGLLSSLRARSDIDARVIATGIAEMTLAWSGSIKRDGQLTVALIWAPKLADSSQEKGSPSIPSAFTVSLPGVLPAR